MTLFLALAGFARAGQGPAVNCAAAPDEAYGTGAFKSGAALNKASGTGGSEGRAEQGSADKCAAALPEASSTGGSRSRAGQISAVNYAAVFGSRYADAENYFKENPWIPGALGLPAEETRIALAVVFPELIRFSSLQDGIEVRGLKVLYVQYGPKRANFSVGRFQMKPTFAEQLESDFNRLFPAEEKAALGLARFVIADTVESRKQRVLRLDDPRWQVRYLGLYMRIMGKRYRKIAFAGAEEKTRFYAAAYNSGYTGGESRIRRAMTARAFHTELFSPSTLYSYADVAAFYFARH